MTVEDLKTKVTATREDKGSPGVAMLPPMVEETAATPAVPVIVTETGMSTEETGLVTPLTRGRQEWEDLMEGIPVTAGREVVILACQARVAGPQIGRPTSVVAGIAPLTAMAARKITIVVRAAVAGAVMADRGAEMIIPSVAVCWVHHPSKIPTGLQVTWMPL